MSSVLRVVISSRSQRPTEAPRSVAESGYNLVILMVLVTVLNVALAAALPAWSHLVKRDKEAELIFRGLQYAEAIRVFQQRHGRLPVRLEELVETYPRSLRQLYPDPMSEHGRWGLLVQAGQPGAAARAGGSRAQGAAGARQQPPATPRTRNRSGQRPGGEGNPVRGVGVPGQNRGRARPAGNMVAVPPSEEAEGFGRPAQRTTGPIVGVYSATAETSLRSFMGQQSYEQWQFHIGLLPTPVLLGDNPAPRVHSGWIGKPFRKDLQAPQPGGPGGRQDPRNPNRGTEGQDRRGTLSRNRNR